MFGGSTLLRATSKQTSLRILDWCIQASEFSGCCVVMYSNWSGDSGVGAVKAVEMGGSKGKKSVWDLQTDSEDEERVMAT